MKYKTFFVAIALAYIMGVANAAVIDGWSLVTNDASDPVRFTYQGNTLNLLSGLGPVFSNGVGMDYSTEVLSVSNVNGYTVMECRASDSGWNSVYYLKFKTLPDNAMEMLVEGDPNVIAEFRCGNIQGSTDFFKQIYTGERMVEGQGLQSAGWSYGSVYWPTGGLYFYGIWDGDWTHGYTSLHRASPGSNFLEQNPPISCDSIYGSLTDGSRPSLKDRYVIRAATDIWESMGPVTNEPSEFRQELLEMVFFDHRGSNFEIGTFALKWLEDVTAGRVKFYSIMQNWAAWNGWDTTNPDAWRIPDHSETWPVVGTNEQLREFLEVGKTIGRAGLRTNYMHIGPDSWSITEGVVKRAIDSSLQPAWYSDMYTVKAMAVVQEQDIDTDFNTTAVYHDQWGTMGQGGLVTNFDAAVPGAGTLSAARNYVREICTTARNAHNGPLGTEGVLTEFLIGKYTDTGDFQLYNVENGNRFDFTPAYKLNRLHQLTTFHSMGTGPWFYYGPWIPNNYELGAESYFGNDDKLDLYRSLEILYGNGGYVQFTDFVTPTIGLRKVHLLTECFTVGVAQRYYALQPVDYVKHGLNGQWKTLDQIIVASNSLNEVNQWYKQFHVRYDNGCHVWVNRAVDPLIVTTNDARQFKLPQNGWLVYTEDGNLTAYTALAGQPEDRVDFCEDVNRGIKYVNPRRVSSYMGTSSPTVWLDGQVHFVLQDPDVTFYDAFQNKCGTGGTVYLPADISGPNGSPDCYVDMCDFVQLSSQWFSCNDPLDAGCEGVSDIVVAQYDFNDVGQMSDWTIQGSNHAASIPSGWLATGGVSNTGNVRLLHGSGTPAGVTLNAATFDSASAEISFSFAMNNPNRFLVRLNGLSGASFFHQGQWWAGDAASVGGATWFNPATNFSAMPTFGGDFNTVNISITNGIADITVNGAELVTGADWSGLLSPTGNTFGVESAVISWIALDDYVYKIPQSFDADISGLAGVPDNYVNFYDLSELISTWLDCTAPENPVSCL